jgi:dihydrofolate synthase/folylpolyglutamate synthase
MTYAEALAYLGSLESLGIRPGLNRIVALLDRLGDPQREFPSVLIAGTNGKGSVAAFLSSILRAAGYAAGLYTSPHLVRFEERVVVGTEPITEDEVAVMTAEVRAAIDQMRSAGGETPTYFEATTALAFLHFARRRVPIAVLEVGLGGRFDATNIVTPVACAITQVAMDHMQWLGTTLPEIAHQKAGILKTGVSAVISRQRPEALAVIRDEADRAGAPLILASDCVALPAAEPEGRGRRGGEGERPAAQWRFPDPPAFSLVTPSGGRYEALRIPLRGAHQVENATAALLLAERLAAAGFSGVDRRAIVSGLAHASWPGRLELLPGSPDLLLDGAHNPAGCESLAAYLRDHQSGRRIALIFTAMKDKAAGEMLRILCPLAARVVITRLPVARGEAPETLGRLAAERHPGVAVAPEIEEALAAARGAAGAGGLVAVGGSLYLVGEVKSILTRRPRGTA